MWLSLFIALLTYLLSSRDTAKERRNALAAAAVAGGATYAATEYTDWGSDLSDGFDGLIGVTPQDNTTVPGSTVDAQGNVRSPTGAIIKPAVTTGSSSTLWDTLAAWGPVQIGAGVGLATASDSTKKLLLWGGLAVLAVIVLK